MRNDLELMMSAKNGDKNAFGDLYERYHKEVQNYLRRTILSNALEEVEDVTQDAFIKALNSIHKFRGKSTVKTWLITIARNTAINHMRDLSRRAPLHDVCIDDIFGAEGGDKELEDLRQQVLEALTDPNTPEGEMMAGDLVHEIEVLVESLEQKYHDVYILRYHEQLEYKEIAEILNLPLGTVQNRLHELNMAIKKLVKEYKLV